HYISRIVMTSTSASSSLSWTLCPSYQRNSLVRINGLVEVISARKTLFQTLMRTGRSRQLLTHLLYASLIIVSEVGLIASLSPSSLFPECVTQNTSGVKPSKCSASLFSNRSGMSRGKYAFRCPISLILLSKCSLMLSQMENPYGISTMNPLALE